jgi:hypothetical protein
MLWHHFPPKADGQGKPDGLLGAITNRFRESRGKVSLLVNGGLVWL